MRILGFLTFAAMVNALSQIALKSAASSIALQFNRGELSTYSKAFIILKSMRLWLGLVFFSVSLSIYMIIISEHDISYAFPAMALSIAFATLISWFWLGERIDSWRLAGIFFIMAGSVLLSFGEE